MSNSANLQTVVFSTATTAAVPGVQSIVDHWPENLKDSDYPFVQIGDELMLPADVSGSMGNEHFIDLHVWSRAEGQSEAKAILDAYAAAFHDQALTVAGLTTAFAYVERRRVFDDPDGRTRHGVLTLKIICHE